MWPIIGRFWSWRAQPEALTARLRWPGATPCHPGRAGAIVAAATFAAYELARSHGLPLIQQRTAATLVTLTLSLTVLVLLAIPLTWRRVILVGAMVAGFALVFPLSAVRRFYELDLPDGYIGITLLVVATGAAALAAFWLISRRRRPRQSSPDLCP